MLPLNDPSMYVGLSVPDNLIVTIQTSHHMDTQKPIVEYILANNIKVPFQNPSNPSNLSCRLLKRDSPFVSMLSISILQI